MMIAKTTRLCVFPFLILACTVVFAAGSKWYDNEPLIKEHKWQEAREFYAKKLQELGQSRNAKIEKRLPRLVLCYHIALYFEKMGDEDVWAVTEWLLGEPTFTADLLAAFGRKDSPKRAFHVLAQLRETFKERTVQKLPGLAIAHTVVWDTKRGPSDKFSAADSFGFYLKNANRMSFSLARMPYEAALFLANANSPPEEREWARRKYKSPKDFGPVYRAPEYDFGMLYGKPKKIAGHEYTLPNLLKYGGICGDRAYYAANVARSWGIPAAWICGRGERGLHAWTGYVEPGKRNRYVWNLGCGRFEYDRYYIGVTRDPQTRRWLKDYELAMRTRGCDLPRDKVRMSDCYVRLASILEKAEKLEAARWALEQATKHNRFNLTAWGDTTRLCKKGKFDTEYAELVMNDALSDFSDELDFCFGIFKALMETVPKEDLKRRQRLYQTAWKSFKTRPDLTVAIGNAYGDYLLEAGKKKLAYEVYHDTIRAHMSDPRLVADMAIKVTKKRMSGEEPKKAISLLKALLKCAKRPAYTKLFARETAWYRLQTCLKGVYQEMGNTKAAQGIEAQLSKFVRR